MPETTWSKELRCDPVGASQPESASSQRLPSVFSSRSTLKNYKGSPYQDGRHQSGAQKIPGRVECAYDDRGGEGVAYHDVDAKNDGSGGLNPADGTYLNQFRMDEGVELSKYQVSRPDRQQSL